MEQSYLRELMFLDDEEIIIEMQHYKTLLEMVSKGIANGELIQKYQSCIDACEATLEYRRAVMNDENPQSLIE